MSITAKIIEHSKSKKHGKEIITYVLRYPRFLHPEVMTHRMLSRNASSSRAIPVKKLLQQAINDMAYPIHWGQNQPGMQARQELSGFKLWMAKKAWRLAGLTAVAFAWLMTKLGLHKQVANRILEPFTHISVIVTATEWDNFFALRYHPDAQPEMLELARLMWEAQRLSVPKVLEQDEWHLPFISAEERKQFDLTTLIKCSVARAARVSYNNHDGSSPNVDKDIDLYNKLAVQKPLHASPTEHQAKPSFFPHAQYGNFMGWVQYRKLLDGENVLLFTGPQS